MHTGAVCVARSLLGEAERSPEMGPEAPQISQTASFDAIRLHRDLGLSAHSTLFVITCARGEKDGNVLAFSALSSPQVDADQDATDARDRRLLL